MRILRCHILALTVAVLSGSVKRMDLLTQFMADRAQLHRTARRLGLARKEIRYLLTRLYEANRELEQSRRDHQDLINRVARGSN